MLACSVGSDASRKRGLKVAEGVVNQKSTDRAGFEGGDVVRRPRRHEPLVVVAAVVTHDGGRGLDQSGDAIGELLDGCVGVPRCLGELA